MAAHQEDTSWVTVDCRFDLADTSSGERAYLDAHIPGAVYAHLDRDLSGATNGLNGRHPLPDSKTMHATFGRLGIGPGIQVVAYDQANGMYASRLWWLLRLLGHDGVAVLDGGFAKWRTEQRPTRVGREHSEPRVFSATLREAMFVSADEVQRLLNDSSCLLVDARAPERYLGLTEPLDRVAGHIPGASNYHFENNLNTDATFLARDLLRSRLSDVIGSIPPERVVVYCGSGVTACHNLLAMEHAGLRGSKLYPGSWSEWCSDPERPVEKDGR